MSRIWNLMRDKSCSAATKTKAFLVGRRTLFGTEIPIGTPAKWIAVHDEWRVCGVVRLAADGEVIDWMSPPPKRLRKQVEDAVREAFGPWV